MHISSLGQYPGTLLKRPFWHDLHVSMKNSEFLSTYITEKERYNNVSQEEQEHKQEQEQEQEETQQQHSDS